MKHLFLAAGLGLSIAASGAAPAMASGVIQNACLKSDRPAANRELCACLQVVADAVLTPSYQKRGAEFFTDPHKSHETRASGRVADEKFWERWEVFAATAVKHCQ
ncbi:hypothetical protein [Sinisalibacter aestuarii]|uniref:Arginine transporter n=1 Tax=Sinisalibacter aestuarii TaxID=2949426 RepID=A0ABQ5LV84_9RHOB|nr:hypothetical protein [Sinisalibacter aestuarii]GKY88891.1 hypothetical protein STA1M1_27600 [Sinisalibacter aestuarii]